MTEAAHTFGLFQLSAAFEGVRKQCREWKFRAMKAEGELEELRMVIHQFAACHGEPKEAARAYLRAEATEYHKKLTPVERVAP